MFTTELAAKLEELILEGAELVKEVRAYVHERREREKQWPWTLYGAYGTEIKLSGSPQPDKSCKHPGPLFITTGGKQCRDCGAMLPH